MTRIDLFRELGLDVETAVVLDDELSTLPARTQRVFEMRARGYTMQEIGDCMGITKMAVSLQTSNCNALRDIFLYKRPKIRAYSYEGEVVSDYS